MNVSTVISNIFSLASTSLGVLTANALLATLLGLAVARPIFGLLSRIFVRR